MQDTNNKNGCSHLFNAVTTTENDTVPLFTGQYFDFKPNNVSWLNAGEQANSGGVYAFTYNELVNILNGETKYGDLKVIDVADMVTGEDYSLYWKVNQEDMYFITPTAISNKALSGGVVGNGKALGLVQYVSDSDIREGLLQAGGVGGNGTELSAYNGIVSTQSPYPTGITTDPTKSGIIAEQSTSQLYFKVANAVQNLELLDAGEVLEAVNNVVPNNRELITGWSFPSNKYIDLTLNASASTYTAPANGWFYLKRVSSGAAHYAWIYNLDTKFEDGNQAYTSGMNLDVKLEVKKGQQVRVGYNGGSLTYFRFIFAEGEQ